MFGGAGIRAHIEDVASNVTALDKHGTDFAIQVRKAAWDGALKTLREIRAYVQENKEYLRNLEKDYNLRPAS